MNYCTCSVTIYTLKYIKFSNPCLLITKFDYWLVCRVRRWLTCSKISPLPPLSSPSSPYFLTPPHYSLPFLPTLSLTSISPSFLLTSSLLYFYPPSFLLYLPPPSVTSILYPPKCKVKLTFCWYKIKIYFSSYYVLFKMKYIFPHIMSCLRLNIFFLISCLV